MQQVLSTISHTRAFSKEKKDVRCNHPIKFPHGPLSTRLGADLHSATGEDGQRIAWQWIEAVVPVADYLRRLARERTGDT